MIIYILGGLLYWNYKKKGNNVEPNQTEAEQGLGGQKKCHNLSQ